jgi:hypothetical protein
LPIVRITTLLLLLLSLLLSFALLLFFKLKNERGIYNFLFCSNALLLPSPDDNKTSVSDYVLNARIVRIFGTAREGSGEWARPPKEKNATIALSPWTIGEFFSVPQGP